MDLVDALRLALVEGDPDVVAFTGGGGKSALMFRLAAEVARRKRRVVTTTTTHLAAAQVACAPLHCDAAAPLSLDTLEAALSRHRHCLLIGAAVQGDDGIERRQGLPAAQIDALVKLAPQLGLAAILVEADGSRGLPAKAPAPHEPLIPVSTTLVAAVAGLDAIGRPLQSGALHRPERIRALLDPLESDRLGTDALLTPVRLARLALHPEGMQKGRLPTMRGVTILNKAETPLHLLYAHILAAQLAEQGNSTLVTSMHESLPSPVRERWGPWGVVVLAAGAATRYGSPKQLAPWGDETLIGHATRTALASDATQILVVTGAYDVQVRDALRPLVDRHAPRLKIVHNSAWAEGQSSSVRRALTTLDGLADAALFLPVDQPFLPAWLLRRLARAWRAGAGLAAPSVDGELRGAPALFDRTYWAELHALAGDTGGRALLRAHAQDVHTVDLCADLLADIDTPADLQAAYPRRETLL